jgi:hypothetical protein
MGFLQLHRKGFCRLFCRRGVWSIHQPTSFGLLLWVSVLALVLVSYVFVFCSVFSEGDLIEGVLIASDCGEEGRINARGEWSLWIQSFVFVVLVCDNHLSVKRKYWSSCVLRLLDLLQKEQKSRIVDSIWCGSRLKEETKVSWIAGLSKVRADSFILSCRNVLDCHSESRFFFRFLH